ALAVGVAGVASGTRSGSRVLEETERAFVLAPGQAIAVENINGPIEYEAWDGREVVVRAVKEARGPVAFARWVAERIPISIEQTDDGVRAGYGRLFYWGFGWANLRLSFRVLVPRDWEGDISLYTSNGRITARDLRGDARLRTSNGSVVVERQAGSLAVKTSNGRIELRDVDGVVTAETSNGAIVVDGARLARAGRLRTSNGPVELRARLDEGASYEVRTSNGAVRLALIEPDVSLNLTTSNGQIALETEVSVAEVGRNRLVGRIGQGAAQLSARTSNGDITVSSQGARS